MLYPLWIAMCSSFYFLFFLSHTEVSNVRCDINSLPSRCRYFYMVAIPKRFHLKKVTLRRESFIQTCGPLILGLGNGTRFVCFLSCSPHLLHCASGSWVWPKWMILRVTIWSRCMIRASFMYFMLLCSGYFVFFVFPHFLLHIVLYRPT